MNVWRRNERNYIEDVATLKLKIKQNKTNNFSGVKIAYCLFSLPAAYE